MFESPEREATRHRDPRGPRRNGSRDRYRQFESRSLRQHVLCGQSLRPRIGPLKPRNSAIFMRATVHLARPAPTRKPSLTATFLRGCSPGPFGTHSDLSPYFNGIDDPTRCSSFEVLLG